MMTHPVNGINVRMIYSACVVIETPNCKILCDPWFTDGIYDGAWFLHPKIDDPASIIGDCDYVYVSHIHPDHYDPKFLHKYFAIYGKKKILVANFSENYLAMSMQREGFEVSICNSDTRIENTSISIHPHITNSLSDIDSALLVQFQDGNRTHRVINLNDCVYDPDFLDQFVFEEKIDILLLGYTGAGPYPQTYFDIDDPSLVPAAINKKSQFFTRYLETIKHVPSKVRIPFAGQYVLGGRLAEMNEVRGVADSFEITKIDNQAIVLREYEGSIDTESLIAVSERTEPISRISIENRITEIENSPMAYEAIGAGLISAGLVVNLLNKALPRARKKSECTSDYFFTFELQNGQRAVLNANRHGNSGVELTTKEDPLPQPRSEISIDLRYLFGLLTGLFHWNNAQVGSQFQTRRVPDQFSREAQNFLNFLMI
jgi:UDP-MurNAc hydroxylase